MEYDKNEIASEQSRPATRFAWDDAPLQDPEFDTLGRRGFAVDLADALSGLTTKESIVAGLYGDWGSGKSTILNFVEHYLERESGTIVYRFNPWLIGEDDAALVHEFIVSLADQLDVSLETSSQRLGDIARRISPVVRLGSLLPSIAGKAMGVAADAMNDLGDSLTANLEDFKNELERELSSKDRSVLIIMDDIDRLSSAQLSTMFRLVKAVGVFSRTRYLLAFDRRIVEERVDESFGTGFIDKIVQVPLDIPHASAEAVVALFFDDLAAIRNDLKIVAHPGSISRQRILSHYLESRLRTIRQAKRLAYAVDFYAAASEGQLDLLDLASYHALRLFDPELARALVGDLANLHSLVSKRSPEARDLVETLVESADGSDDSQPRFHNTTVRHRFFSDPNHKASEGEIQQWIDRLLYSFDSVSFSRWLVKQPREVAETVSAEVQTRFENTGDDGAVAAFAHTSSAWVDLEFSEGFSLVLGTVLSKVASRREMWLGLDLGVYLQVARIHGRVLSHSRPYESPLWGEVLRWRLDIQNESPLRKGLQGYDQQELLQYYFEHLSVPSERLIAHIQDAATLALLLEAYKGPHYDPTIDVARLVELITLDKLELLVLDFRLEPDLMDAWDRGVRAYKPQPEDDATTP